MSDVTPLILLLEDEVELRHLIRGFLQSNFKAEFLETSNGDEAIRILRTRPVQLLISDIAHPGADGYTVAQAARENGSMAKTRILILSMAPDPSPHFPSAVDSFLGKPFEFDELRAIVKHLLADAALPATVSAAPAVRQVVPEQAEKNPFLKAIGILLIAMFIIAPLCAWIVSPFLNFLIFLAGKLHFTLFIKSAKLWLVLGQLWAVILPIYAAGLAISLESTARKWQRGCLMAFAAIGFITVAWQVIATALRTPG